MRVREKYVKYKLGEKVHHCTVCGKRARILHKANYFCSDRCKEHYRKYKNKFPYTPDTMRNICVWFYTDGIAGLAGKRNNTKDTDMSIWNGVTIRRVKNIIRKCQNDGSYDRYIGIYKSYRKNGKPKSYQDAYSLYRHSNMQED